MKRTFLFLSALGIAGMMSLADAANAQPGGAPGGGTPAPSPPAPTRPTIAVFNMAAVMRDFGQAKYQVYLLTLRKMELSKNLDAMRKEYIDIAQILRANPNHPEKDKKTARLMQLKHSIEDEDTKVSEALNKAASDIISDLYDKVKAVVDRTAEINGYHIVFAYPDAATAEDMKNPIYKELKLKPPAAQPFYVAPHADITAVVTKTLNGWYPPKDPVTQKVIDVSKLKFPDGSTPGSTPGTATPNGGQRPGPTSGTIPGTVPGTTPAPGGIPGKR